ncbi:MAG: alpha/beta hydrolase [Crocinitomicaceae bacterium]|nr:alpha/beta hydrolase [Crocinitomicaceae bacterium]
MQGSQNFKNEVYNGANGRKSLLDLVIPENYNDEMILFIHGYMGFKDWGCWNLVSEYFCNNGYGFCKFNLSHNGGTIKEAHDFPDKTAFAQNRYSYEVEDVKYVIDWIYSKKIKHKKIHLMGHSRGGAIAILAGQNKIINSIICCASICDIESRFPNGEAFETWKKRRTRFITNGRTKDKLEHYFTQYEDFKENEAALNIKKACIRLNKPVLLIHGENDESVSIKEGESLAEWLNCKLQVIESTKHTFGAQHPWDHKEMPTALKSACEIINTFLTNHNNEAQ